MLSNLLINYLKRNITKSGNINYRFLSILINENVAISKSNDNSINIELNDVVNNNFSLLKNFISTEEETALLKEIEKSFRRTRYEYDHWDGVRNLLNIFSVCYFCFI